MIKRVEHYKNLIEDNGYINKTAVIEFLSNNCIADFGVIADIFNEGMSICDYEDLQQAISEIL